MGNEALLELTFDIEKKLHLENSKNTVGNRHVFVTGLARSGSTILMQTIFKSDEFSSLTYRDMPFVMAPNTWSKITGRFQDDNVRMERVHADGIRIDYDSPEALEEVFWRVFGGKYVLKDRLVSLKLTDDAIENFRIYINLINRKYNKQRYLSKNNNNILRLPGLLRACPNAIILIPFRDPLDQAQSLLNQHRNFIEKQQKDRFIQRYMTWLVHHEFGIDHRPFEWGIPANPDYQPDELDYWLVQWIGVYKLLMQQISDDNEQQLFVSHELLCEQAGIGWNNICKLLDIPFVDQLAGNYRKSHGDREKNESSDLLKEAYSIYHSLKTRSAQRLLG
ncbi:MAG: hypothetical protein A3I13_01740 [Gammaproteobacteria bacterium RIFCSPLOWO2_02_FULL_47_50]|nr:MAG: hypothetical protein A2993_01975 [Gammaproteobacteria bacterium RIFCSPLOWO2_01_FULL_47_190]OGT71868.1 MAG: hypothetical protein A2W76_05115 [Gammaproteobacteria bacterium RIFCSPLOWO2_12_47_11]OGT79077.1 MAG: hypothetical protein A3I13_01740 [Gammaproteobacteria bacterium RIFCSPLOWO2_02_FULL_47_50]OGT87554.1 MAG: hypothetical protein A3G42_07195 [Gammaproteobacteria bacterium RIFCSPLOWO2_12_FULL_47_76]